MRKNLIIRALGLALLAAVFTSLAACNTVHGAGKDIERGGEHLQNAAD
jgi:predicted small secreted protein